MATANGQLEAARLLLEAGADPSRAGGDGVTPLMEAVSGGQPEVLRLLLARGAAVDAVKPPRGWTAFHGACYNNQPECVEALVRAGCDVGLKDVNGMTGRQLAEALGYAGVVERLRAAQTAGPEPEPAGGGVVLVEQLCAAAQGGDSPAVMRLLAAGADPNAAVAERGPSGKMVQRTV